MNKLLFTLPMLSILISGCSVISTPSSASSNTSSITSSSNSSASLEVSTSDSIISTTSASEVSSSSQNIVIDGKHRNYYQLLVYSFADSNNDGWGDFKGIIDKLDYLKNLGINGIWLSPFLDADDYHGYNVKDYYKVFSKYEVNNTTIKNLIDACHAKDINVLMDLVLNHTSINHTWYSSHHDWYSGVDAFDGNMKDLNYDKAEVVTEVKKVGKYWLNQGIDGFRLDAAMWIFNNTDGSVNHNKNYTFWNDWCNAMREVKEDVYIVGEVLDSNHNLSYQYSQAGFSSTFDFNAPMHTYNLVKNGSYDYAGSVISDYQKINATNFVSSRPLSNHDFGRFSQQHPSMDNGEMDGKYYFTDRKQLALANAINALTPGTTYIYYGDELGLQGNSPDGWKDMSYRTPMPWDDKYLTKSTEYYKNYKGNGNTTSYIEGSSSTKLSSYIQDNSSLYQKLSKVLKAKMNNDFVRNGTLVSSKDSNIFKDGLSGFTIQNSGYKTHLVFNPTNNNKTVNAENVLASTVNSSNNSYSLGQYDYIIYYTR